MPKTSVDEDGNHQPRKNNVRNPTRFFQHFEADPVAQTSLVQLPPQCDLSAGPLLPDFSHSATCFGR